MGIAARGVGRPDIVKLVVELVTVDLFAALVAIARIAFIGAG